MNVIDIEKQVSEGLDFILSHLKNPNRWPRTISTKESEGRQITVYSKYEALSYYKESNYLDCRISAYNTKALEQTIDLLMIDLDLSNFKHNIKALDVAKEKTLAKIQDTFYLPKFEPTTILWSGNGYHFYIPAESKGVILEQMSEFGKYKEPSKEFLRFAEYYLSNGKADSEHYHTVSFKNCLLRIPGSFNSKNHSQVQIVQKWNGTTKVQLDLLYSKFLAYLIDQERNKERKSVKKVIKTFLSENGNSSSILWIERLLQTPLPKYRKYCVWRILAPYLINVKHLSFEESFDIIDKWLYKCNELEELDFDTDTKINDCLNGAVNRGYLPISFDNPLKGPKTLKTDNRELYDTL